MSKKRPRFLLYADGSISLGFGHIMRTLALAVSLTSLNIDVIFVSSEKEGIHYINNCGFQVIPMQNLDYNLLISIAKKLLVNGLLVDKFGFQLVEHQRMKDEIGFLAHIDDFNYQGPADLIINCTLDSPPKGAMHPENWLCGGKYAIIRPQFSRNILRNYDKTPENILITTGYCDPYNIHLKILKIILSLLPHVCIQAVIGGAYQNQENFKKISNHHTNVVLHSNVFDLSDIMFECDMAITAAGTTLYELAATGIPTAAISFYDNQIDNLERASKKGSVLSLGWYEDLTDMKIADAILKLYHNKELRHDLGLNGLNWIDGKGSLRIAKKLKKELVKR